MKARLELFVFGVLLLLGSAVLIVAASVLFSSLGVLTAGATASAFYGLFAITTALTTDLREGGTNETRHNISHSGDRFHSPREEMR